MTTLPSAALAPGARVGRYVVLRVVGQGGMGIVYAAHDPDLDRTIALKLLRPVAGGTRARENDRAHLLAEAQAMARVAHPNVVSVFDVGAFADEVFVAMELIDGVTLRRWMELRARRWRQILDVFLDAGRGLAAAHVRGIVHRDFKPENVLIGPSERVRVTDFGLARRYRGPLAQKSALSSTSATADADLAQTEVAGTPQYMAPEQFQGIRADHRADQFAFCVALFEALYGSKPYAGRTAVELYANIRAGRVRTPARRSVPQRFHRILLRGIDPAPEGRFESMEALLAALSRDPAKRWRRAAWIATPLCALAGLSVALTVDWSGQAHRCHSRAQELSGVWGGSARDSVRRAFLGTGRPDARGRFRKFDEALRRYLLAWAAAYRSGCDTADQTPADEPTYRRLQCLEDRREEVVALVRLASRPRAAPLADLVKGATGLSTLAACSTVFSRGPPPPPPGKAREVREARRYLARIRTLGTAKQSVAAVRGARDLVRRAEAIGYGPLQAEAHLILGDQLTIDSYGASRAEGNESIFRAAALAEAHRHDRIKLRAFISIAWDRGISQLKWRSGHRYLALASAALERLATKRGTATTRWGRRPEPTPTGTGARTPRSSSRRDPPNAVDGLQELAARIFYTRAEILRYQGKLTDALAAIYRAEAVWARSQLTPLWIGSLMIRAAILRGLGRTPEAIAAHREALGIAEQRLGADHPFTSRVLNNLGNDYYFLRRMGEAEKHYRASLKIIERVYGKDDPRAASRIHNIAEVLRERGKWRASLRLHRRALKLWEGAYGAKHALLASALVAIGKVHLSMGAPTLAVPPLERARTIQARARAPRRDRAETHFALARALWGSGLERLRARRFAERALRELGTQKNEPARAARKRIREWLRTHRLP